MSGAQKFSLSLLISVVAFSGFAVLAWSGLFDYIETTFYLDRVQSSIQLRVERISGQVEGFHRANLDRFSAVLNQGSVRRAFEVDQAREDIVERNNYFDSLQSQLPSLDYVRFLDLGGTRLHFSTREDDFNEDGTSRIYTPLSILNAGESYPIGDLAYDDVVDSENAHQLVGEGVPTPDILLSPANNQFIYRFPVLDEFGLLQGTALFYLHAGGLSTWLVRDGLVGAGDEIDLILTAEQEGPAGGVLVNSRGQWSVTLESGIAANWPAVLLGERPVLSTDDSTAFTLFSSDPTAVSLSPYIVLYLFPEGDLQMTDIMKIVLLAATFLSVFLLVFLLFNFRQDAVVVLSDRVKRFQISLLREYMENKQDLDFQRWRAELEDRRGEVAIQIRRGIGRVRASQKEEVDKLIDSSWDEILEVLGSRAGQVAERGVDLERLEDIVERVIGNLQSVDSRATMPRTAPRLHQPTEETAVEEIEEIEEMEEIGEADEAEEAADMHALGEPIEVEEISEEEFGEVEAVEEIEEIEEMEEIGEAGEAEEAADVHVLGEPIEVEEISEEELGEVEAAEEIEEIEEMEEISEAGEAEEAADVHALGEPIEVEEISEEEIPEVAASGEVLDEAAELEWLAESEILDITETSLEDLEVESEGELPLLEGESIAEDDEGSLEELEEIDYKLAVGGRSGEPVEVEELDSVDSEMPSEVGDLEGARSGATPFMAGTFSFGKGTELNLPSGHTPAVRPEEDAQTDAIEDLEMLGAAELSTDEIVEAPADDTRVPDVTRTAPVAPLVSEGSIRFTDIRSMVTPEYEIASIRDILDRLHIDKNVLIDRDGLVEIDRKVYGAQRGAGDDETRQLVDSVTGDQTDAVTTGIEELFGAEASDLFADLGPSEPSDAIKPDTERSVVRFVDRGFDYDGFLRGYHKTEGGVIKSLVTFTRQWRARVGVLFAIGEGELVAKYGLGLEESCLHALHISRSSGIYRNVLEKRLVLFVNRPLRRVEYFLGLCPDEEISAFQKVLFLPVIIHGEEGYALLGLQEATGSLDEAFGPIVPLLTSVAAVS